MDKKELATKWGKVANRKLKLVHESLKNNELKKTNKMTHRKEANVSLNKVLAK